MTEESFQQGRKLMQKANYWRGKITIAKGNVSKWTKIEATFRSNLQPTRADGAKQLLDKAMERLKEVRATFAAIKFPENNIETPRKETTQCEGCGSLIAKGNTYCGECLCEDDSDI